MEVITSFNNAFVKRIAKLAQKKYRDECGEFLVEGYRNVSDTAGFAPKSVHAVILSLSAYETYGQEFKDFNVTVVSDAVMQKMSATETSQGVLSVNAQKKSETPTGSKCILLDRVRDPGNVGTVLRTALAAGYDVILNNCADLYSPKVVRSAMSAVLKCRIAFDMSVSDIKALGYDVIVADMGGTSVFDAPSKSGKYCIVIGNEADGVSREIKDSADSVLSIPQKGIESLNAAVAAGIMMYALGYMRRDR